MRYAYWHFFYEAENIPHPSFYPNTNVVASGCQTSISNLWMPTDGAPFRPPLPHQGPISASSFFKAMWKYARGNQSYTCIFTILSCRRVNAWRTILEQQGGSCVIPGFSEISLG